MLHFTDANFSSDCVFFIRHMRQLTFPPAAPAGILNSIDFPSGNGMILPLGNRSAAFCAPLRICNKTGTVGGTKTTPLTLKSRVTLF